MIDDKGVPSALRHDPLRRAIKTFAKRGEPLSEVRLGALAHEVLDRIRLSRPSVAGQAQGGDDRSVGAAQWPEVEAVSALCDALMGPDAAEAVALVAEMRVGCSDPDVLYDGCIGGAVRLLGDRWERGEASISQVIIGSGRVYAILRSLRDVYASHRLKWAGDTVVAFAPVPGEQHALGAVMAAEHFRRLGWAVDLKIGLTHDELVRQMTDRHYPIIALAASSPDMAFALARMIVALRVSNPGLWIMVAGPICTSEPHLMDLVDADAVAPDLASAERQMSQVLRNLALV
jgi:MerR family transcriptional regulator, light-induced transcriptional regulator